MKTKQVPHRPGPLHQTNKAHKAWKHTKSNQKKIKKQNLVGKLKLKPLTKENKKLGTTATAPLLVGVIDLHLNNCQTLFKKLKDFKDKTVIDVREVNLRFMHVISSRLKQRLSFVDLNSANFDETLDIVKSLDIMITINRCEFVPDGLDSGVHQLLRTIRLYSQPKILHILDATKPSINMKDIANSKKILRSAIEDERLHVIEKDSDLIMLFHLLSSCKNQSSNFKNNRPQLLSENITVSKEGDVAISGFVRQKRLSANQLVHVLGEDYQIKQIDILPDPLCYNSNQIIATLKPDLMRQESLDQENELDPMEGEQTFPIEEDEYDEGCTSNSEEEEKMDLTENSDTDDENDISRMEEDEEDENDEEYNDCDGNDQVKAYNQDMIFPDEVDTPAETPARIRFARYRGLKSFKTSGWDPHENLPTDYSRIFKYQNFGVTRRRAIKDIPSMGADSGQYVRIILANVSADAQEKFRHNKSSLFLVGLLKHERKMTVMNLLIKKIPGLNLIEPIKSKDELIFYVGHRKFRNKPLYSNNSASTKFKLERFLRDDTAVVATMYAPTTYPAAPVLVFKEKTNGGRQLVASGTVMDANPNRLIIKRIKLAGHPFKIHSKTAVIRFMFYNNEDVLYFKPVELITRHGRRGHISEALGTHGHMKCIFDRKIRSDDCIFMNLYKRVFPKYSYKPY